MKYLLPNEVKGALVQLEYKMVFFFFLYSLCISLSEAKEAENEKEYQRTSIRGSGLPIPRFVMTKSKKVKLRVGPGDHYPSRTTYIKKGVPLLVTAEFEYWRKIKDFDNEEGWIHKSLLMDVKTIWINKDNVRLMSSADCLDEEPVAILSQKTECALLKVSKGFAKISVNDFTGWVPVSDVWGILP
jgi:SH3-like domain-containing protein